MKKEKRSLILAVDDDKDILELYRALLSEHNLDVITAGSGETALEIIRDKTPDLILLDVMMPGINGYHVCAKLQQNADTAFIPVIFVTALREDQNKTKAFSAGAVDFVVKPVQEDLLLEKIHFYLDTGVWWSELRKDKPKSPLSIVSFDFIRFKEFLSDQLNLPNDKISALDTITLSEIYPFSSELGITDKQMARYIADFLKLSYISKIDPDDVELGRLPVSFCRANLIMPIREGGANRAVALSNPFKLEVIDVLERFKPQGGSLKLVITEPANIESILKAGLTGDDLNQSQVTMGEGTDEVSEGLTGVAIKPEPIDFEDQSALNIANKVLYSAVRERASDIHIEVRKTNSLIRFRVDGDLRTVFTLKKKMGAMLISRFKVLGDMDIAERRKPQDGTLEAMMGSKNFRLRLATTCTPEGEYLVIRLLEPYARPRGLNELGMTNEQVKGMIDVINRTHGLILVVGPTGSGKTTTIYSLLSQIDCQVRNLVSVEDPVEYRIPFANQQQVNVKAGITFETLLKSVVRQDPDIIFMGEIRDQYSAKMAMDFASTGHLTLTTLHTSNATTAVFRLERLGVDRCVMAEAVLCIIAQRLVKKLCPHCKKIEKISAEETGMLAPFTDNVPSHIANPAGCSRCNNTGYLGREGIYEILKFDTKIAEMVRSGTPISEIRDIFRESGVYLISNHAVEKVRKLLFAPKDVYRTILAEEIDLSSEVFK